MPEIIFPGPDGRLGVGGQGAPGTRDAVAHVVGCALEVGPEVAMLRTAHAQDTDIARTLAEIRLSRWMTSSSRQSPKIPINSELARPLIRAISLAE